MPLSAQTSNVHPISDRSPAPPAVVHIEDTGLAPDVIEQLLLKTLYGAELVGAAIAERMRLSFTLLEPLVEHARAEQLIEVKGANGSNAVAYRYSLTDLGRERARQFLDINQYVGPTPVPLPAWASRKLRPALPPGLRPVLRRARRGHVRLRARRSHRRLFRSS